MLELRAIVASIVVLGACSVGEAPPAGDTAPDASGGTTGEQSFASMIKPLVTRCTGCHASATAPNLSSFSALQAKYKATPGASNVLVTKGVHSTLTMYFSASERATVAAWIDSL